MSTLRSAIEDAIYGDAEDHDRDEAAVVLDDVMALVTSALTKEFRRGKEQAETEAREQARLADQARRLGRAPYFGGGLPRG